MTMKIYITTIMQRQPQLMRLGPRISEKNWIRFSKIMVVPAKLYLAAETSKERPKNTWKDYRNSNNSNMLVCQKDYNIITR